MCGTNICIIFIGLLCHYDCIIQCLCSTNSHHDTRPMRLSYRYEKYSRIFILLFIFKFKFFSQLDCLNCLNYLKKINSVWEHVITIEKISRLSCFAVIDPQLSCKSFSNLFCFILLNYHQHVWTPYPGQRPKYPRRVSAKRSDRGLDEHSGQCP